MKINPFNMKQYEFSSESEIISACRICRIKLTIENAQYKQQNLRPTPKLHFNILKNNSEILLPQTIKIHPGNYCYPLKENFVPTKEKNFFYRYYGEEKIEEVTKKVNSITAEFLELPDDLLSNIFLLYYYKKVNNVEELGNYLKVQFNLANITNETINKRLKKLYDRYHSLILDNSNCFYHMSCGINEMKDYESLIGTNKQLFCGICWKYDCNLHQPFERTFDSPQCYNVKEYLRTYKIMNEISYGCLKAKAEENQIKEDQALTNLIYSNCEKYNLVIQENKLAHFSGYINFFEEKSFCHSFNKIESDCCCSEFCYKNFLHASNETKMKIFTLMKRMPNIYELYLTKLVQIFKYDPCSIAKCLKLVLLDDFQKVEKTQSLVECYVIFLRLISNDFSITRPLTKETIDIFVRERCNDKKKLMESQRLKIIRENARNSK